MKKYILLAIFICSIATANAQIKILFDATKAETAGNADWVIDADVFNLGFGTGPAVVGGGNEANAQRLPTPAQSGITAATAENYWKGGISSWGVDCVKKGYEVETLPHNGSITYGNATNAQDLSNYKIFVVVEPNIVFTATEKTAIINFVKMGGSLFLVSDHTMSDRNNDGWDSPGIWNDLFTNNTVATNPFGISFDLKQISPSSSNVAPSATDSLIHGSYGNVTQVLWSAGTSMTLNTTANSTVKGAVFTTGSSNTGTTNVLVAYARYGLGKVVAFGDSSPFDDGSGDTGDQLYDGYITDASGNHQKLIMNATIWLATPNPLPLQFINYDLQFRALQDNKKFVENIWQTDNEINVSHFNIERSTNGKNFETIANVGAKNKANNKYDFIDTLAANNLLFTSLYYRIAAVDIDGKINYSTIKQVSINDKRQIINIFPNPAKDVVNIIANDVKEVRITNLFGQVVYKNTANIINNLSLNVKCFPKGIYFVQLYNANGFIKTEKLIIE